MSYFDEISELVQNGKAKDVKELVSKALEEGVDASQILNDGLLAGMAVIGEKFKRDEVFVPQVLVAARAMNSGVEILKSSLVDDNSEPSGVAILGTVKGDLHDIGKNLVKIMLEGKGLEVIDLGVDVPAEKFIDAAIEHNADVICCSALLTTTMSVMKEVVELAAEKGIRDDVKVLIGGAPVTQDFCDKIGADVYTNDAASCADEALKIAEAKRG